MKSVQGYINRKSMLYKTGVEYGDYTMNHVLGCAHGCRYPCYAFLQKKRFGQVRTYDEWLKPFLVSNTLEILDYEIPRLKSKISSVQLCFTTDPFMFEYPEIIEMSLASINKLNNAEIKCSVLTKGLLPPELAQYSKDNQYGITLISLDEGFREKIEPGAAPYKQRIDALKFLHNQGCNTWVSIEPYPTPNLIDQDLIKILEAVSFTNKIIFGRTNYNKDVSAFKHQLEFYRAQTEIVAQFCKNNNILLHIKRGTLKILFDQD